MAIQLQIEYNMLCNTGMPRLPVRHNEGRKMRTVLKEHHKPGELVHVSGIYDICLNGERLGRQITAIAHKRFPPARKPGATYRLEVKARHQEN